MIANQFFLIKSHLKTDDQLYQLLPTSLTQYTLRNTTRPDNKEDH